MPASYALALTGLFGAVEARLDIEVVLEGDGVEGEGELLLGEVRSLVETALLVELSLLLEVSSLLRLLLLLVELPLLVSLELATTRGNRLLSGTAGAPSRRPGAPCRAETEAKSRLRAVAASEGGSLIGRKGLELGGGGACPPATAGDGAAAAGCLAGSGAEAGGSAGCEPWPLTAADLLAVAGSSVMGFDDLAGADAGDLASEQRSGGEGVVCGGSVDI